MVFYFTDTDLIYNIYKKVSSKTLSLHLLVQKLKALELTLLCRLELIHVLGTTMITQGTDGIIIGIRANGLNTDFKSFTVEVFLPSLPSLSRLSGNSATLESLRNMPFFGMRRRTLALGSLVT
jgi:hypothetical protein